MYTANAFSDIIYSFLDNFVFCTHRMFCKCIILLITRSGYLHYFDILTFLDFQDIRTLLVILDSEC